MALVINIDSIMDKVEARLKDDDMQAKIKEVKKEILSGKKKSHSGKTYTPESVAAKFVDVLQSNIDRSVNSKNVKAVISDFSIGSPVEDGDDILITVSYANDLQRESLVPDDYPEGIFSLAKLFNEGAEKHGAVFGEWHGEDVWSTSFTPAAHFEEDAKDEFMSAYADEMHVKEII